MSAIVRAAVRREGLGETENVPPLSHRVPIGLVLVEQGHLSITQLHRALAEREAANAAASRRIGEWLIASGVLDETALRGALSAQWRAPMFSLRGYQPERVVSALPEFLSEAFGALPLDVAEGGILYLAFDGKIHRSLGYGLERMLGLRVLSGIAPDSEFRTARSQFRRLRGPKSTLFEAVDADALVRAVTKQLEREKPADARLVRIHEYFWLRLWRHNRKRADLASSGDAEDLVATVGHGFGRIE
ncbi:MAG: hypothetical protein WA294_15875 [Acidobacteriaceae bacterium]